MCIYIYIYIYTHTYIHIHIHIHIYIKALRHAAHGAARHDAAADGPFYYMSNMLIIFIIDLFCNISIISAFYF